MLRKLFFALGLVALLAAPSWVRAEGDEDESKVLEAANSVIEGLPAALKTGVDFSKMTPAQKIDFVLTSVESKVQDDVADKFKEELFDKAKDMAKEAIRAKTFLEVGVPQIKHAYAMGQAFDWSKIDADIASRADTRMNALGAGVKTLQIGWGAYQAYSEGNWSAAVSSVGGELADMLAEAVVPGYGYIKIGAEMVEFLGNYVLDYATDTAVEGMLENMYGMKSDPQGLAQWLINKSPSDITKDLNQKFDDGDGFGYLFRGQGTDKGDEAIKGKVQAALIGLRGELLVKKKEQEQKERRIKEDIDKYMQKYKDSQAKVKAVADKAKAEADKLLGPVKEFRRKVNVLRKQDIEEQLTEIKHEMDTPGAGGAGSGVAYVPLDRAGLLGRLKDIYDQVSDTPGIGYDRAVLDRLIADSTSKYSKAFEDQARINGENCRNALKEADQQFHQPMADLANRIQKSPDSQKPGLTAQLDAISARHQALWTARATACSENTRKMALEKAVFHEEENLVTTEAQERADRLSEKLQTGLQNIADGIRAAQKEMEDAKAALHEEINTSFTAPVLFFGHGYVNVETCAGICGIVEGIEKGELQVFAPGNLESARDGAVSYLEGLRKDQAAVNKFSTKERDILKRYQAAILSLRKEYESLVARDLRAELQGGNEEAQKSMDENVAQYGIGNAGSEIWDLLPAPLVQLHVNVKMPYVTPPVKYFDQQMAELAKLEPERQKKFAEGIKNVERMISVVDYYADLDRIGAQIIRMVGNLDQVLTPGLSLASGFSHKDRVYVSGLDPAESDGAKELENARKLWDEYEPYVMKLAGNVKAYGKGVKYLSMTSQIDAALKSAAFLISGGDRIKAREKQLAQNIEDHKKSMKSLDEELARLQADFKTLQDPSKKPLYQQTLRSLRSTFDQLLKFMAVGDMRGIYKDKYIKLRDDVEAYAKKREVQDKADLEEYMRQQAAASSAAAAAEQQRQEAENRENVKRSNPLLYYGYQLTDPRVNTYSVAGVGGDIVVTRDKLVGGQMELTARLNHTDHVKTLLISEDGGRTWKQIAAAQDVRYAFTPIPNKPYQPVLKIKTDDMVEVGMNFLDGGSIVYQDAEFSTEVLKAVQEIADCYERQDAAGFAHIISREFLGNKTALEDGVRFDFDMFADIRLTLYVDRVDQRGTMFAAETRWDKSQTPRKTGEIQKTSGKTTMYFVMEDGRLKLRNLRGNLLYATLSADIAQASGLKGSVINDIRTAQEARNPTQPGAGSTTDAGGVTTDDGEDEEEEQSLITVTSPNGGENWTRGSTYNITWTSTAVSEVRIEYEEGPDMWFDVVASTPAADGSYAWTIDGMLPPIGNCRVRITAVEDPSVVDMSDNTFSVL